MNYEEDINRRNNNPEEFKKLLSVEIPKVLWDTQANTFKNIGLTADKKLIFYLANGATVTRNAEDRDGDIIKWKWLGRQPVFSRLSGKNTVFFASGVAEWLLLDWFNFDYIVLPSDAKKKDIKNFKNELFGKALIILPDNDHNGSFQNVIDFVESVLSNSHVFNTDFYPDKDFRDYGRRTAPAFNSKEQFIDSLLYNIWICVGGSEAADSPITEESIFELIKGSSPAREIFYYDPLIHEYTINGVPIRKDKLIEHIKNTRFKGENLKEMSKKANILLYEPPNLTTVLDIKLPFGENGDKFNVFRPTDVIEYQVKEKINFSKEYLRKQFPYTHLLLKNLFTTDETYDYFVNWFSFVLNTHQKTRNCIVFTGAQGTGKGLLYRYIIERAFGKEYCGTLLADNIKSNFTQILHNKLFIVIEEMDKWLGRGAEDKIKTFITEETITIERKYFDSYNAENKFNMFIFSNSPTPVKIESTDRRFSVIKSNIPIKEIIDTDRLIEGLEKESYGFLICVKSLNYDAKKAASIFETEEKDIAKEGSMPDEEYAANLLKEKRFYEITEKYPEAEDEIKKIKSDIGDFNGYSLTSSVNRLFSKILPDNKKIKNKLHLYFGKAKQIRLKGESRGNCYKICEDKIDETKQTKQRQNKEMQYL